MRENEKQLTTAGIWALKTADEHHNLLVVSFVDQTGFLAINNEEARHLFNDTSLTPRSWKASRCRAPCLAPQRCTAAMLRTASGCR